MTKKVTQSTRAMLSPSPAGDDGLQLNSRGSTRDPVTPTGLRATMQMRMRRDKHDKPMVDQRRIWKMERLVSETQGIVLESVKIGQYISDV